MRKKRLLIVAFFGSLLSSPGFAAYKMGEERPVKISPGRANDERKNSNIFKGPATEKDVEIEILISLSNYFDVSIKQLQYFRSLRHGYEEIVPAFIIARTAQIEAGRILGLRMKKESWKSIAGKFHINLKPLNKEVLEVLNPIRKQLPKTTLNERPQIRK